MARALILTLLLVVATTGAGPPSKVPANLEASLRDLLLQNLPSPLYEDTKHWGGQRRNLRGQMKNDGRWWKLRIEGRDLANRLQVQVRNLQMVGPGRKVFGLYVDMEAGILLERQTWKYGVRLYSGSTRARVKLHLALACEVTSRLETKGGLLPDLVVSLRIVNSDFRYDGLVVEHTAGVGGDAAKLLGEAVLAIVKQVKPSLERRLLEKANAAILKAGNLKEVRIGLMGVAAEKK